MIVGKETNSPQSDIPKIDTGAISEKPDKSYSDAAALAEKAAAQFVEYHGNLQDEDIIQRKSDRVTRDRYSKWIFWFVPGYLVLVALMVICQNWLGIHDHVLMVFISTTVVNTVGLLMGVVRYLFPVRR